LFSYHSGAGKRFRYRDRRDARPPLRAAARRFWEVDRDERLPVRLRDRLLPLVSPFFRRVLLTVAAAMRFAVPALRPRLLADRLMCWYCLSRLLLQDLGIRFSLWRRRGRAPPARRNAMHSISRVKGGGAGEAAAAALLRRRRSRAARRCGSD